MNLRPVRTSRFPLTRGNCGCRRRLADGLHTAIAQALTHHNANAGSAGTIARLAILSEPASLDAGEITGKGYVNQRKVLARRCGGDVRSSQAARTEHGPSCHYNEIIAGCLKGATPIQMGVTSPSSVCGAARSGIS